MFSYEILENNTVLIWADKENAEAPLISQPHFPNGDAWTTAEAEMWASAYINKRNGVDASKDYGISKDAPVIDARSNDTELLDEDLIEEAQAEDLAPEEALEEAPAE